MYVWWEQCRSEHSQNCSLDALTVAVVFFFGMKFTIAYSMRDLWVYCASTESILLPVCNVAFDLCIACRFWWDLFLQWDYDKHICPSSPYSPKIPQCFSCSQSSVLCSWKTCRQARIKSTKWMPHGMNGAWSHNGEKRCKDGGWCI